MQIFPMCKKFIVHKEYDYDNDYSVVEFSVKLKNSNHCLIPGLKYRKILSKKTTNYSNGAVGREEITSLNIKQPPLTSVVSFIHDKMKYGKTNIIRRTYLLLYSYIFRYINK